MDETVAVASPEHRRWRHRARRPRRLLDFAEGRAALNEHAAELDVDFVGGRPASVPSHRVGAVLVVVDHSARLRSALRRRQRDVSAQPRAREEITNEKSALFSSNIERNAVGSHLDDDIETVTALVALVPELVHRLQKTNTSCALGDHFRNALQPIAEEYLNGEGNGLAGLASGETGARRDAVAGDGDARRDDERIGAALDVVTFGIHMQIELA
jgi:hypothetical protein